MSICYNCGVKIKSNTNKCPLCNEFIDNNSKNDINKLKIETIDNEVIIKYFSKTISILLIFGTFITVLVNLLVSKRLSWSFYVVFSTLYIVGHYYIINNKNKILGFLIDVFNIELLLLVISYMTNNIRWFIYLVGPFILFGALFIVFDYLLLSKVNRNILRNDSYLLLYIGIITVLINALINVYNTNIFKITWSIYVIIPVVCISIIMYTLSFNKKIVNEIEKRFFI